MNDVKTLGLIAAGLMLLQACSPQVPASSAGPGFNDYADYELERARREPRIGAAFGAVAMQNIDVEAGGKALHPLRLP